MAVVTALSLSAFATSTSKYLYVFDNERFLTSHIELEFDGEGNGEFRFKKKGYDDFINKLQVSKRILSQIDSLVGELNYLESTEDYQYKKDFSHLGNISLTIEKGGKTRTVKFNYTENPSMNRLANLFRNLATQESRFFEIESVRQSDPLSTPAQLRFLESELKSQNIADPDRFTALLTELKGDEGVPLIARNHADRLLKDIAKMKNGK